MCICNIYYMSAMCYIWASLIAQLVMNSPPYRRPWFNSWVGKISWRRDRLPSQVFLGFPCGSTGKESICNTEAWVRSLGWEYPPEKGKGPTPVFWTTEFHVLYSPWGCKESDTTDFHFQFHFYVLCIVTVL